MGALTKKTEARSGRHTFEASGPSLPFPNCQSGGGIARCCRHNQASWPECLFMAHPAHARANGRQKSAGTCDSGPGIAPR